MITISAQIENLSSRADRSWKIVLGTQELTPQEIGTIGAMQNQIAFVAINPDPFTTKQKEMIENTKAYLVDGGKSQSQRLRGVLFVNWQNENLGYENFHDYYINQLDKIISHFKSKLP